ncbi:phenylacetate--CoA ligase [Endothiovibrio diazotrophicus]
MIPFSGQVAALPAAERDARLLRRLNALLRHARRASYYRERIPARPLPALEALIELPVLDRTAFREHAPPAGHGLLTRPPTHCYCFASGGTTDQPRYVYRSHRENALNCRLLAKGLALGGLRADHVVANLLAAGELWAGMWVFDKAMEYVGSTILPLGSAVEPELLIRYLHDFRVDAAICVPSQALALAEWAAREGRELRLPRLITGGEPLYPAARRRLADALGVEAFQSTGYAANETGVIGYPCPHSPEGTFHLHEGLFHLEILGEEGTPAAPGEPGSFRVTNLYRTLMPIIRYVIGDIGSWLDEPCPCGDPARRFRLLGRDGARVRLGTSFFYPDQFAERIGTVEGVSMLFRLVIDQATGPDRLTVEVEANRRDAATAARLLAAVGGLRDLAWEIDAGYVAPLEVRLLAPGELPRNRRTGKLNPIDDRRGEPR